MGFQGSIQRKLENIIFFGSPPQPPQRGSNHFRSDAPESTRDATAQSVRVPSTSVWHAGGFDDFDDFFGLHPHYTVEFFFSANIFSADRNLFNIQFFFCAPEHKSLKKFSHVSANENKSSLIRLPKKKHM